MKRLFPAIILFVLFGAFSIPAHQSAAQEGDGEAKSRKAESARAFLLLPTASVTRHTVKIGGKAFGFTATVGTLEMKDAKGAVQAEIGYVSYVLDDEAGGRKNGRPITVAMNGGPGAASAYLNLMAIGPWRLQLDESCGGDSLCRRVGGRTLYPSSPVETVANEESWLPFTDLVFIDPPGTGYSRAVGGEEVRKRFYSVDGDIDLLSAVIARWLRENDRLASPKFFVGESYGGFRGPLLAEELQTKQGIGLSGLVLISPVLDFNWIFQSDYAAWAQAGQLPSFAAANLELQGKPFDDKVRKEVEDYAAGQYVTDLMRGLRDKAAVARVSEKVASLTGLDTALVNRMAGRIDMRTFQRERLRDSGRVLSAYDTVVASPDPDPTGAWSRFEDPLLSAMTAPLASGMVDLLRNRLGYKADDFQYQLLNNEVNRMWDWGRDRSTAAESMTSLRKAMALDPAMQVLVVHGATDLVTPYFTNRLLLNQLPELGNPSRVQLTVFPGGHMFYSRDESRRKMRDRVSCEYDRALVAGKSVTERDKGVSRSGDDACP